MAFIKIMICVCVLSVTFVPALLVVRGKGDHLIAGYNTATDQEKAEYNIKRLRIVTSGTIIAVGLLVLAFLLCGGETQILAFLLSVFFVTILNLILSNTWAKRR